MKLRLALWGLAIALGIACYHGIPPTVCNPADYGCTQPFGSHRDAGVQ